MAVNAAAMGAASTNEGGTGDASSSVVIAGAGIIGLATAWRLLRHGFDVTVLDAEPVSGATFAAAGMLAPVAEVVWDQPTLYPLMVESGKLYRDFAQALAEESGHDVGYIENSTFVCAGDAADRQTLSELVELQHDMGMEINRITATEARRAEPALGPGCVGAVDIPGDHQVNPRLLAEALLSILGDRAIRTRAEEVIYASDASKHSEQTDHGAESNCSRAIGLRGADGNDYLADEVVLAAGLNTADIAGLPENLNLPLRPVYGDVLRLRVPERLQPLVTRTIRGVVQGRPVYIVPRADGTVVLGATSREDDLTGVSAEGVHQLLRDAYRLVPGILDCEIYEMTARARPGSPDDVPMIGRVAPGLTVSTGYFRHGILLTAIGSKLTADVVAGRENDNDPALLSAVNPFRFSD
ncbi:glycine oxidase ThiO [Corynebacterium amycolatum]|uniref:glycine oxidase ThiO n=1 Tax=Corynebacterium amycolatum TaxID=43765 RepID=UPI003EE3D7F0